MLLKNIGKRLINVNTVISGKSYRLLPGNNPSVEVPNEYCEKAFIQGLIQAGEIRIECKDDANASVVTESEPSEYDGMKKADLVAMCESLDVEVTSRDTCQSLIDKLEAHDAA